MSSMRTAGIDIGTNSVRLLIADIDQGEAGLELRSLHRLMNITRLGQGVDSEGRLNNDAVERTVATLRRYRDLMREERTEAWEVAATSAARDAANAAQFVEIVTEIMGSEPKVLSGHEEARLSFTGATYDLGDIDPQPGPVLVIDIGGGSTEFIVGEDGKILEELSLDMGCVRLSERFPLSDPPRRNEVDGMQEYVRSMLRPHVDHILKWAPQLMIGLAGTVTTLSGIKQGLDIYNGNAIHHSWLSAGDVEGIYGRLCELTLEDRRSYMRLEPGRADVIIGGASVLVVILRELEKEKFLISEKDMLDGLAITAAMKESGFHA